MGASPDRTEAGTGARWGMNPRDAVALVLATRQLVLALAAAAAWNAWYEGGR